MVRWLVLMLCLAFGTVGAEEPEPGRTDGPEGSEYGTGGYRNYRTGGEFYIEGFFGSASVDFEVEGERDNQSETDLMSGIGVGYMVEDWLSFQVGYGVISDQDISLLSAGTRTYSDYLPFSYFFSVDGELFIPDQGDSKFAVVPGAGVELLLTEKLRMGLSYQHDFVFSDENLDIDRVMARVHFRF
jgi:hypothetical protein